MSEGTPLPSVAMYVVYESPLEMLADSPTRYRMEKECMKFLSRFLRCGTIRLRLMLRLVNML